MKGTLVIQPVAAQLLRDNEIFGKMDPFCVIKVGVHKQKTKTHRNGGKFPSWRDTLKFEISHDTLFIVEVWDKDLIKNDKMGECTVYLKTIFEKNSKSKEWYPIYYKGKVAGEVSLQIEWIPSQMTPAHANTQYIMNMNTQNTWNINPYMAPPINQPPPFYHQNTSQAVHTQPMVDLARHSQPAQQPLYPQGSQYVVYPMVCRTNEQVNNQFHPIPYMMPNLTYIQGQQIMVRQHQAQANIGMCYAPQKHELSS